MSVLKIVKISDNNSTLALIDNLEYIRQNYEYFYGSFEVDASNQPIVSSVKVGIRSKTGIEHLVEPRFYWEYTADGTTPYSDLNTLLSDLQVLFTNSSQGSISQTQDNFSLFTAGSEIGQIAYAKESQGTSWLPAGLGGTYYPAGFYVWTGSEWTSDRNNMALALSRVTNNSLGWIQVKDSTYPDILSPLLLGTTRTALPNNAGSSITVAQPSLNPIVWNGTTGKFEPDNEGDCYSILIQFSASPLVNIANLQLDLDIGGAFGVIWDKAIRLTEGAGVVSRISETITLYTLDTFVANGGQFFLTSDVAVNIFDVNIVIQRTFRNA